MTKKHLEAFFLPVFCLIAGQAMAHTGEGSALSHGWLHPLTGLDHMTAMIAVGAWSAQIGGRAIWIIPVTFVSFMFLGGLIGFEQVDLPYTEIGVAFSIILLGLAIAFHKVLPIAFAVPAIGIFGICHGYLHGYEMPIQENRILFTIGFLTTTATLHIVGIIIAYFAQKTIMGERLLRIAGAISAIFGVSLLIP